MINEENWLNHPALKDMEPRKKKILLTLAESTKGKPMTQSFPLLLAATQELQKSGLSFTNTEKELIFEILSQDLSPEEKKKVQKLKTFLH